MSPGPASFSKVSPFPAEFPAPALLPWLRVFTRVPSSFPFVLCSYKNKQISLGSWAGPYTDSGILRAPGSGASQAAANMIPSEVELLWGGGQGAASEGLKRWPASCVPRGTRSLNSLVPN